MVPPLVDEPIQRDQFPVFISSVDQLMLDILQDIISSAHDYLDWFFQVWLDGLFEF